MASIGPKSGSRTRESRRVTSFKQPSYSRGGRIKRPETVDQLRAVAKAFQERLRRKHFSKSDR
jgi:hypothetical protein